jgi:hypothetical protein
MSGWQGHSHAGPPLRTDLLERKAHALKAWNERLKAIVTGEEAAEVVQLHGAK